MSELRQRLAEAADAAAREGRVPTAAVVVRRGRRRRLRLAGGTAALVALVLVAVAVGTDRLVGPAPLTPTATTRPSATSDPPDVSILPDPGEVQRPAGAPSGTVGEQMVLDVATEVAGCPKGDPNAPAVLFAWGQAHDRTWLIVGRPPLPGDKGLCWAHGLFEADGTGGISGRTPHPRTDLAAGGSHDLRSGDQWWGHVVGPVTKRAARVRVLFDSGIPPLELEPIQTGDRFPVNFYSGFYRQPAEDPRPATWQVVRVVAYDQAGNKVAECQATPGPGHSC